MHKHLWYSFKSKKGLYVIYLLTIVVATIVSIYHTNVLITKLYEPYTGDINFQEAKNCDLVALNNLVESGDIKWVNESFFRVKISYQDNFLSEYAMRENCNKWFGSKFREDGVIVSTRVMWDFPNLKVNDEIMIGKKPYTVVAISETLETTIVLPYITSNKSLNASYKDLGVTTSSLTIGFDGELTKDLKSKIAATGIDIKKINAPIFYYDWKNYIIPAIVEIIICVVSIVVAYGFIIKKDKKLNAVYQAVGANEKTFVAVQVLEMLLIFSIGYGLGCAAVTPMLNEIYLTTNYMQSLQLFTVWAILAVVFTGIILFTKRKIFRLNFKKSRNINNLKIGDKSV